jgi:biopolymer transport protein ExbD
MSKKLRKRITASPRVTLTPLIDTALVLLVIFMVATPMMRHAIKVELPQGETNEADLSQQHITIVIDNKNQAYIDDVAIAPDAVIDIVQKKVGDAQDQMVTVYADTNALYGPVMELVERLKSVGGIHHVAFTFQRPHKQGAS